MEYNLAKAFQKVFELEGLDCGVYEGYHPIHKVFRKNIASVTAIVLGEGAIANMAYCVIKHPEFFLDEYDKPSFDLQQLFVTEVLNGLSIVY